MPKLAAVLRRGRAPCYGPSRITDARFIMCLAFVARSYTPGRPRGDNRDHIGPGAVVRVINEGPVLSAKDLSSLKQRLNVPGRRLPRGAGLGLSIVDELCSRPGDHLSLRRRHRTERTVSKQIGCSPHVR